MDDIYRGIGLHVSDKNFLADGFWFLQGVLAGIGTNDLWRILNLPGEGQPIIIGNSAKELEVDYIFQLVIAGAVIVADLFGLKHGVGFGSGMILGSTWANMSESGSTVTLLPFSLEAKTKK